MRRLIHSLAAASLLALLPAVSPAQAAPKTSGTKAPAAHAKYVCPKCGLISSHSGNCPYCKVAMKSSPHATAAYECKMCHLQSTKAGKCPKCGMTMSKVGASMHH